jgi:hypothetical protein
MRLFKSRSKVIVKVIRSNLCQWKGLVVRNTHTLIQTTDNSVYLIRYRVTVSMTGRQGTFTPPRHLIGHIRILPWSIFTFSVFPVERALASGDTLPGKLVWFVSKAENIPAGIFLFSCQIWMKRAITIRCIVNWTMSFKHNNNYRCPNGTKTSCRAYWFINVKDVCKFLEW